MKTIAFFGGSHLAGIGYPDGILSKDIYPNIVSEYGYNIKNYGIAGAGLHEIFLTCLHQLTQSPLPDVVCIEWNMLPRHRFYPAPSINICFTGDGVGYPDNWNHCIQVEDSLIDDFHKVLMLIDGDYHRMLTLLRCCKIVENFCKFNNIDLIMCNGDIPWTKDLFDSYDTNNLDLSLSLSDYSKELLDIDNRDDNESLKLLSELKQYFDQLDLKKWVFIFDSVRSMTVDRAPLDTHPGPKTMKVIADCIINFLKKKNI